MDQIAPRRAVSLAEFGAMAGKLFSPESQAAGIAAYKPRPTDVIITPYGKCGTTWLQQIFHTLRTRGDFDYDDISRVVPWIETSRIVGLDIEAQGRAEPRGFKSHLGFGSLPKGTRYLVSLRDPKDSFVSMFRFMEGWFIEPGAIPIEDFFEGWLKGRGPEGEGYWHHLLGWWAVRADPNVMLTSYNRMVDDPAAHLRRLAEFIGVELDDDLLALAIERTSRAWMLAHKDRFDDFLMRTLSETKGGIPSGSDSAKVRAGASGNHKAELPASISERMDAIWAEKVTPVLGYRDFAELEAAL